MDISRAGARVSTFKTCVDAAEDYGLTPQQAQDIIDRQVTIVRQNWADVREIAGLTRVESNALFGTPYPQIRDSAATSA
jgi:serine/threonine-protein kinase HipA